MEIEDPYGMEVHDLEHFEHSRRRGHYCGDFDGLWICEDCEEFENCLCFEEDLVMTAEQFLDKCAQSGGRIVSSNDLHVMQIAEAQACHRFYVDPQTSYGYAIVPWSLTTDKDREREHEYFKKNGVDFDWRGALKRDERSAV
jgi:hypothetical protein